MKRRSRVLRTIVVLSLTAGAATVIPLVVSPEVGPAQADVSTGTAGLFVPTQGSVLDTRTGIGGVSGPVAANAWYPVQVGGQAGVPTTGVSSVQVSVTVLSPATTGLVKVAANGTSVVPIAALTYTGGGSISASSITALPADGKIQVLAQTSVTLLVHVQGYYTAGNGAPAPGGYVPVNPARVVDTRIGTGLPQVKLATGSTTPIQIGGASNVPADASAVFVMLTAISTSATAGYFSPYPTGTTRPPNVSLNYLANTATILGAAVDLGTGGQFNLWIGPAGTAIDVIVDVIGYYTAIPSAGGAFTPAAARVYDSRISPNTALPANTSRVVQVGGVAGVPMPSSSSSSVAFSAQVVHNGSSSGSLALGPGDQSSASVAAVYFSAGSNARSNLVVLPAAIDGSVLLTNSSPDTIHVILDVEGWYSNVGPGQPGVASDHFVQGGYAAATSVGEFSFYPGGDGTPPATYTYSLDGAAPLEVPSSTASASVAVTALGAHTLTVFATDKFGVSSEPYVAEFSIGTRPSAPQYLTVQPGASTAKLGWAAPATDGGVPVSTHIIYQQEGSAARQMVGWCGTDCRSTVVSGLLSNHDYSFSVAAMNEAGEGAASTAVPVATSDSLAELACADDADCEQLSSVSSLDNPDEGPDPDAGPTVAAAGINQAGVTEEGTTTPAQADRMNAASTGNPFGCRGMTDRPHSSTFKNFVGWASVHARTKCSRYPPGHQYVHTALYRKRWYGQQYLAQNSKTAWTTYIAGDVIVKWDSRGAGTYTYTAKTQHEADSGGTRYYAYTSSTERFSS